VKHSEQVLAVLNFTYYPSHRLAFISYMATAKHASAQINRDVVKHAAHDLLYKARAFLRRRFIPAKGILIEVDAPETARNKVEQRKRFARIARFSELTEGQGLALRRVDVNDIQPELTATKHGQEMPLALLYVQLRAKAANSLSKHDADRILRFVCTRLYGDSFEGTGNDDAYRAYTRQLYESVREQLPDRVRLIAMERSAVIGDN
jgi:hypothetical protein